MILSSSSYIASCCLLKRFKTSVGVRFWIHYSVTQLPTTPGYFYFKIFSNGENITNWGIDTAKVTAGTVAKGLYEPDESWHYRDEAGKVFKQDGIESRLFSFTEYSDNRSLAGYSGVFEVQVFRAQGRRRCAPRLGQCKFWDEHGILYDPAQLP